MNFLVWIIFGAIAGWVASLIMKNNGSQGTLWDIIMGIVGSIVGSYVFNMFGEAGVTGFNLYSLFVSVVGACIVIFVGRMLRRGA